MPAQQAKHWCFTLNNYTDDECDGLEALGEEMPEPVVYLVYGKETAPDTGTPHLQGYIGLSTKKTLSYIKSLVSTRAHCEVSRGSPESNRRYCTKEGDFKEFGTLPRGRGARTDLTAVAAAVKEGRTMREICELDPSAVIRYGGGILRLRQWFPQARRTMEIHVFWGPTGVGKTRRCWDFTDHSKIWVCPGKTTTGCWFDGYDDHEVVLFDDFNGSWFEVTYFLKLIDRYRFTVPVKGGFFYWNPSHLFITSNQEPSQWYGGASEAHQAAVMRKLQEFGQIVHCLPE